MKQNVFKTVCRYFILECNTDPWQTSGSKISLPFSFKKNTKNFKLAILCLWSCCPLTLVHQASLGCQSKSNELNDTMIFRTPTSCSNARNITMLHRNMPNCLRKQPKILACVPVVAEFGRSDR